MRFEDFEYDNINLSDFDCIVCTFGTTDMQTISTSSEITFNTVSTRYGAKNEVTNTQYDSCIEATFQICKRPDCEKKGKEFYFSIEEVRQITSWLHRKQYHPFRILNGEMDDIYFNASFHISALEYGGNICGLELTMRTDKPYAFKNEVIITKSVKKNETFIVLTESDEEEFIYPKTVITLKESGDFTLHNKILDTDFHIKNCKTNEVITIDYPLISSSDSSHKIQNDFNWEFIQLDHSFRNNMNIFTASLACEIQMKYSPVAKIGL